MDRETVTPAIGMGVTSGAGSDCYPHTVIEIISPKKIVVQSDNYRRTDANGWGGHQEYIYWPNPNGAETTLTLRKNGKWVPEGLGLNERGYHIGERRAYYDPHK
jgi:hypothetical protein